MKEHRQNGSTQGSLAGGLMAAPGKRSEKVVKQRRDLYNINIIRTDVFHGDKHTRAAVERLKKRGASDAAIRVFEDKAARVSTPLQIAGLEREVTP